MEGVQRWERKIELKGETESGGTPRKGGCQSCRERGEGVVVRAMWERGREGKRTTRENKKRENNSQQYPSFHIKLQSFRGTFNEITKLPLISYLY